MKAIILSTFLLLTACDPECITACKAEGWDRGQNDLGLCLCSKSRDLIDIKAPQGDQNASN